MLHINIYFTYNINYIITHKQALYIKHIVCGDTVIHVQYVGTSNMYAHRFVIHM